jgi:UDP-GlcNAc3NAcA epimerase
MPKIITIVGARPQFVKAAALSRKFKEYGDLFNEVIVHTGQHFDKNMSDVFFDEMEIPQPNYNLNIHGLSHGAMTGQMLEGIEKVILEEKPDYVMVYGDTNSTIAGALAAKKLHVKVIHVEAGLRSFNMRMPEEVNRILTDRISDILYCPTQTAMDNLEKEGYKNIACEPVLTGDIMQDAALFYKEKSDEVSDILSKLGVEKGNFILGTIHRAENTDDLARLGAIVSALNHVNTTTRVVVPLHPRTSKILKDKGIVTEFTIIEPVGYFDMLQLIAHSRLVMTDSGGLQKEAYFFNKYCITLRDETEWVELVKHGYNTIVGADMNKIIAAAKEYINKPFEKREELYGGGMAAHNMCEHLKQYHQKHNS